MSGGLARAACTYPSGTRVGLWRARALLAADAELWRAATQARDCGWLNAATAAQLEAMPLLRRADLVTDRMRSVHASLEWRAPAVSLSDSVHEALGFASLPHAVALQIFALLPADARARAGIVCRAWRAAVAEPSLWTRLDLSHARGVKQPVSAAVLRGAAALARGALEVLVLDGGDMTQDARLEVVEVVAANAGSLRELSCCFDNAVLLAGWVEELALAAPRLRLFAADTAASVADANRMLRNEAPFGALRMRHLWVEEEEEDADQDDVDEITVLELAAAMPGHAWLQRFDLEGVVLDTPAALDAITAAALTCRLQHLILIRCNLSPASVPALARLICGGALKCFEIDNDCIQLLDEPVGVQLAAAIAASRTLTRFTLTDVLFWDNADAATAVMRALTGHPSVRELALDCNDVRDAAAAGAALGALVAANAPALQELDLHSCNLGDAGLGPLMDALLQNTHLRVLDCSNTGMSEEFARDCFLPAVQANTSLRKLAASEWWGGEEDGDAPPELLEAEALVAARSAAAGVV